MLKKGPKLVFLVTELRIAAMQKTQNGSGWQVEADLYLKNSTINEKLFGKSKCI